MEWWLVREGAVFGGGFLIGAATLLAVEALVVYLLIKRLTNRRSSISPQQQQRNQFDAANSYQQSLLLDFGFNNKGVVWVLEADKIPKFGAVEKTGKDQKKKKEVLEVTPLHKLARIKDGFLVLTDCSDSGSCSSVSVPLKGCLVEAVSATALPSRKWAKRFPIKVENRTTPIYNGSKLFYLYLETSWEKESWCKALRLASCDDEERLVWFSNVNKDFQSYLKYLNAGYPSFMKPSVGVHNEFVEKENKHDTSTSKFQLFVKKLAKKASKAYIENKESSSWLARDEKKNNGKSHSLHKPVSAPCIANNGSKVKLGVSLEEENVALSSSSTLSGSAGQTLSSMPDADSDDKFNIDEGTLCWNLLISRLFFDAKNSANVKNSVQERIQRTLSNMRIPSYIGDIICTDLDLGTLPPHVRSIRVLPTDMNEAWAWEVDVEYSGGVVINVETRLEVHDVDLQKGIIATDSESTSVGDVSSDLLEGFEYYENELSSKANANAEEQKDDADLPKLDSENPIILGSTSASVSRWKSILNNVAKQVSQVPLSLSLRVSLLRGTIRFHIKPPPSDQLWYGFTSMPDLEFDLETSVGEHKIASGRIVLFLLNRFKSSIRETLVIPNSGSVSIPWMLAEKNDWVPRKVAPFMWIKQENPGQVVASNENLSSQIDELKPKMEASRRSSGDVPELQNQKTTNSEGNRGPIPVSSNDVECSTSTAKTSIKSSKSMEDLSTPLLSIVEPLETCQRNVGQLSENTSLASPPVFLEKPINAVEEDDLKPKKVGTRARMLDLGKKMGEKLEEKRRHLEEKGRNIVEKMREERETNKTKGKK